MFLIHVLDVYFKFLMVNAVSGSTMADEVDHSVEKPTEPDKKVKSDVRAERTGCSHYARKCILIVS